MNKAGSSYGGAHRGAFTTEWVTPQTADKAVYAEFTSDAAFEGTGVVVKACEYQRYDAVAQYPVWTPLRFPGQYADEETGLFENWNRYYDPSIGRYLQPEPLLGRNPRYLMAEMNHGRHLPVYAYAMSNPLFFVDPTGLGPDGGRPTKADYRQEFTSKCEARFAASPECQKKCCLGAGLLFAICMTDMVYGLRDEDRCGEFASEDYYKCYNPCFSANCKRWPK